MSMLVSGVCGLRGEGIKFQLLALKPSQIVDFFEPIFDKAEELEKAYERFSDQTKVPFITVSPCSSSDTSFHPLPSHHP